MDVLKQRSAWGSFLGLFCNAYSLYFLIAWLPFYLVRDVISLWTRCAGGNVPHASRISYRGQEATLDAPVLSQRYT
jgi:hypothetical protein